MYLYARLLKLSIIMNRIKVLLLICLPFWGLQMTAQNWDINTLHKFNQADSRFVRGFSNGFSKSVPYIVLGTPAAIAIYGGIKKDRKLLSDALYIGTSVAEAAALTFALKYTVDRPRPYDRYPDLIHPYSLESSPSFPSTHTALAFTLATSLSIRYPKWYVIAPSMLWATGVGISRMTEGVHYPSDVIAGAVIGAGCAVVNVYVNRWLDRLLFKERR